MTVVFVLQAKVEWTTVPVVVKIYKLLINEMSNQIEHSQSAHTGEEEEEEVSGCQGYYLCLTLLLQSSIHPNQTYYMLSL